MLGGEVLQLSDEAAHSTGGAQSVRVRRPDLLWDQAGVQARPGLLPTECPEDEAGALLLQPPVWPASLHTGKF